MNCIEKGTKTKMVSSRKAQREEQEEEEEERKKFKTLATAMQMISIKRMWREQSEFRNIFAAVAVTMSSPQSTESFLVSSQMLHSFTRGLIES